MQIRCCCCGMWLYLYMPLTRAQQLFCDHCAVEGDPAWRTGSGKGQCQSCIVNGFDFWNDPKPDLGSFQICVR